jgi:serine protease DegS|tara:strand:+ start:6840 stop:7988 length:1149 start_codon:yes stop_codon:yes gene_type:complete
LKVEQKMMSRLKKIIQFTSWPAMCGILLAIVFLQYQQLQRLSQITATPAPPQQADVQAIPYSTAIRNAAPSVVSINATSVNVESVERASQDSLNLYLEESASLGSGVILNQSGFILTNLHVVDTLFDAFDTVVTLNDGRSTPATVVAWDEANDLAVLHINMDDLTPIDLGDEQTLEVGDIVFAIGYPRRNIGQSVSQGIISAISITIDSDTTVIQTDAAINPGNSGGALIDRNGKLVGINSSIYSESGNFEGIGFATPVSLVLEAMKEMVEQAISINPGYLGVTTGEVLNEQSSQLFFGVPHIRGLLVEQVDEGGAAQRAGITPGDVITGVEGNSVVSGQDIIMDLQNKKPIDQILVQVYRDGQTIVLPTILGFGQAVVIGP